MEYQWVKADSTVTGHDCAPGRGGARGPAADRRGLMGEILEERSSEAGSGMFAIAVFANVLGGRREVKSVTERESSDSFVQDATPEWRCAHSMPLAPAA